MLNNNKYIYCINCGKAGHSYKSCIEPIISYGVIGFKIDFENLNKCLNTNLSEKIFLNFENTDIFKYNTLFIGNHKNYNIIKKYVKFLLISRKCSLGFIEFIRGHYNTKDIDTLIHLFKQMY